MQMQMAVNMVEREAGRVELCKLRVNFGAQLFAQAAIEKIAEADGNWFAAEFAMRIDKTGNFFRRQGRTPACQRQVQTDAEFWVFARERNGFIEARFVHHQTRGRQNAFTVGADDGLINRM